MLIDGSEYGIYKIDNVIFIKKSIIPILISVFSGTRALPAGSKCHDLVVIDAAGTIISGHFDKKIRIWDTYTDKCRTELQYNAVITSLSHNAGMKNKFFYRNFNHFFINRKTAIISMFKR